MYSLSFKGEKGEPGMTANSSNLGRKVSMIENADKILLKTNYTI